MHFLRDLCTVELGMFAIQLSKSYLETIVEEQQE